MSKIAPLPSMKGTAVTHPDAKAPTRAERVEYTFAPDAVKARMVVRRGWLDHPRFAPGRGWTCLCSLAEAMVRYMNEQATRDALERCATEYRAAVAEYMRTEGRPESRFIDWMGFANPTGFVGTLPGYAPEHKHRVAKAWDALLTAVNHATAAGVHMPRGRPIQLVIDPDLKERT